MKALVVGGNGFIGSHLVDQLLYLGWEVVVLDLVDRRYDSLPDEVHCIKGDITQSYLVREALTGVEIVFHLAWASIHEISNQDPAADVQANLIPTIRLLESCTRAGVQKIVFTSSGGTVYGPAQEFPILESHAQNPINGYGITKLAVEKYLYMFHHLSGLDYAIVRPSVPYGPRQNPLGKQGAVAVFLHRIMYGLPISIWGDGSTTRDYFYISDLVQALVACALSKLEKQRVFNIGGAEEISLVQLIELIERIIGKKAKIEYRPARNFDAQRIVLDTHQAREELNWFPKVSLPDGINLTWKWMESCHS